MRHSVTFLLLLIMWPAAAAHAQPPVITGIVIDDRTERPIRGAVVFVEGFDVAAETDAAGRFALAAPAGLQTIAVSVVGYAFLRADVTVGAAALDMTVRLSEGAGTYTERITVSGTSGDESSPAPGSSALFGRELENLRGVMLDDPLRAMHALPAATSTDDFYSEFAVRGSTFRHVGLSVDGMPARYLMHTVHGVTDGGSIAMINSETLGSVALMPGSYPQRTVPHIGAQANLTTREGNRERFRARAGLSGTSATFLGEGPLRGGRGSWLASIRRSYLDYLIERIDPEASFAFGFYDGQAQLVYDLTPRHQLSMTTLLGRALFDEEAPLLDANDLQDAASHAWLTAIAWRYTPGPRVAVTQRVYSTGFEYGTRNPAGQTLQAARRTDAGWRADASVAAAPGWLFEVGADAQRLAGRSVMSRRLTQTGSLVRLNEYSDHSAAASGYGQVRIAVGSRLQITPGLRFDWWQLTSAAKWSPWAGAELSLTPRTKLRAGTGLYRQAADIEQVHGLRGGGTALRPERALHADVGIEHLLSADTRLLVTAYSRAERDVLWTPGSEPHRMPDGRIVPGFDDAVWVNALRGRARGGELLLRRESASGLSGWAGYAFGRHRYSQVLSGETFPSDVDQRHTVSLYGNYRLSSRTTISAKWRYGSNYPLVGYLAPNAASPIVDNQAQFYSLVSTRNTARLPAYSRLDVRADRAFTWSGRRLVLFVEVANTLGRTNLRGTDYRVDRTGRVFGLTEPLMPIVPSAGFVFEF